MLALLCFMPLFFWMCRCCGGNPDFYYAVTQNGTHLPTAYKLNLSVVWQAKLPPVGTGLITDMDVDPTSQTVVCADGALTAYRNGNIAWSKTSFGGKCFTVAVDGNGHIWTVYPSTGTTTILASFDINGNQLSQATVSPTLAVPFVVQPKIRIQPDSAQTYSCTPQNVKPNSAWSLVFSGATGSFPTGSYTTTVGTVADVCAGVSALVNNNPTIAAAGFTANNQETSIAITGPLRLNYSVQAGASGPGNQESWNVLQTNVAGGGLFMINNYTPVGAGAEYITTLFKLNYDGTLVIAAYDGIDPLYWNEGILSGNNPAQMVSALTVDGNGNVGVVSQLSNTGSVVFPLYVFRGGAASVQDPIQVVFGSGPVFENGYWNADSSSGDYIFTCFGATGLLGSGQAGFFTGVQRWTAIVNSTNTESYFAPDWTLYMGAVTGPFFSVLSIDTTGSSAYGFSPNQTNSAISDVWKFTTVNGAGASGSAGLSFPVWAGAAATGADTNAGTVPWAATSSAIGAPDGTFASAVAGVGTTQSLDLSNFDVLASSSGISGFQVAVLCKANPGSKMTLFCELSHTGAAPFNRPLTVGSNGLSVPSTGQETTLIFGSPADLWSQITGVINTISLFASGSSPGDTISIDAVELIPCGSQGPPFSVVPSRVGSINLTPPALSATAPTPNFPPVMSYGRLQQPN